MFDAGFDVAVIGGGPSGLAAALRLKARGVSGVAVIEREDLPGGAPRHCPHLPFGMREFGRILSGPAYAARLGEAARVAGVEIWPNHEVTALRPDGVLDVAAPEGAKRLRARRVLLAMGAREAPPGAGPPGVLNMGGLRAHMAAHGAAPFRRPVLLGTEWVSLSALAACRHHGIRPVAMIGETSRPAASRVLMLYPRLVRVPVYPDATIERIDGIAQVERVVLANGRSLDCDGVLFTGRLRPETGLIQSSHLRLDAGTEGPAVDQYGRCSDPAFFAAGNVLRAAETAWWSYREGELAGDFIADDLSGGLPCTEGSLEVLAGANLRFAVPQRLAHVAPLRGRLQLRAAGAVKGQLRVRAEAAVLYRRRVEVRPGQRILIDLDGVKTPPDDARLIVEIVPGGGRDDA